MATFILEIENYYAALSRDAATSGKWSFRLVLSYGFGAQGTLLLQRDFCGALTRRRYNKIMRAMLQNVPILAGLDEAALTMLWERAVESKTPAGGVIVREGETGNRFFLVAEGTVRVCRGFGQPDEVELARLGARDFFGEMCILETLPRAATVQAVDDTKLYSLTAMTFYHLYQAMPAQHSILLLNIARDLSRRLRHLDEVFAARH